MQLPPPANVERINANAEHVRGDKPILRSVHSDYADDGAVEPGKKKAGPVLASHENGCSNGEEAG